MKFHLKPRLKILWPLNSLTFSSGKRSSEFISPWTSIHQAFFFFHKLIDHPYLTEWDVWLSGILLGGPHQCIRVDWQQTFFFPSVTHEGTNSHPSANHLIYFEFLDLNSVAIGEFGIPCCETTSSAVIPLWRLSVCDSFVLVSLWLLLVWPKD